MGRDCTFVFVCMYAVTVVSVVRAVCVHNRSGLCLACLAQMHSCLKLWARLWGLIIGQALPPALLERDTDTVMAQMNTHREWHTYSCSCDQIYKAVSVQGTHLLNMCFYCSVFLSLQVHRQINRRQGPGAIAKKAETSHIVHHNCSSHVDIMTVFSIKILMGSIVVTQTCTQALYIF